MQEKMRETMVRTRVSGTCGRDGDVSPELLLRLRAPVDHCSVDLGIKQTKKGVRDVRKDT